MTTEFYYVTLVLPTVYQSGDGEEDVDHLTTAVYYHLKKLREILQGTDLADVADAMVADGRALVSRSGEELSLDAQLQGLQHHVTDLVFSQWRNAEKSSKKEGA